MIRIEKGDPPAALTQKERELVHELKRLYELNPSEYNSGIRKFEFTEAYKMDAVRAALLKCQHNKCCFSEALFTRDYSNVEHFRPKGRVDPYPKGKPYYPGYYWLAYSWENLFLCKAAINSSDKRNFFPLAEGSPRNRNHKDSHIEIHLLIDVNRENPRDFIRFRNDEIRGINKRGKFNIKFFGLRHHELVEARRSRFKLLKSIRDLIDMAIDSGADKDEFEEQITVLRASMGPEEPFSSMAIDFLQDWRHIQ